MNQLEKTALRVRVTTGSGQRTLEVNTPIDTTVGELTRLISEREELPVLDPAGRVSYTYRLRHTSAPGVDLDPTARLDQLPFKIEPKDMFLLAQHGRPFNISSSRRGLAVFSMDDSWSVDTFQELLASLRDVYRSLFAQNQILVDRNKNRHYSRNVQNMHNEIVSHMRADEILLIKSISINSPGLLEVIGALNPLETIRKFLDDHRRAKAEAETARVQRSKDDKFRDAVEQAKHMLEIESLKTSVAKERANMLRDAGYDQQEIRPYVEEVLTRPLSKLLIYHDNNKLECKSVTELDSIEIEVVMDEDGRPPLLLGSGDLDLFEDLAKKKRRDGT